MIVPHPEGIVQKLHGVDRIADLFTGCFTVELSYDHSILRVDLNGTRHQIIRGQMILFNDQMPFKGSLNRRMILVLISYETFDIRMADQIQCIVAGNTGNISNRCTAVPSAANRAKGRLKKLTSLPVMNLITKGIYIIMVKGMVKK